MSSIPNTLKKILSPLAGPFEIRNLIKGDSRKILRDEALLLSDSIFTLPLVKPRALVFTQTQTLSPESRYLWVLDDQGFKVILESTPCTSDRGHACHSNITQGNKAYHGGELWFHSMREVTINFFSGRYNTRTEEQDRAVIGYFESIGFQVHLMG